MAHGARRMILVAGLAALAVSRGLGQDNPPVEIFFPPFVPVLGAPALPAAPSPWPAPAALADYVDAPFYAPLSTRLARQEIGDDLAYQLDRYRAVRAALLDELQAHLYTLRSLPAAQRTAELKAFAAQQTPRIAAWEVSGEALRQSLCRTGTARSEVRRWVQRLAGFRPLPAQRAPLALDLVRIALFYQDGLSIDQRQMLRELAADLEDQSHPGRAAPANSWFLLPAPGRLVTPANTPAPVLAAIARYQQEDYALRAELQTAVLHRLGAMPPDGWAALATLEAPRFAQLEADAEVVREDLAAVHDPLQAPQAPVPPELNRRIEQYRSEKLALQHGLLACAEAARAGSAADASDRIRLAIQAYERQNADRYAALNREHDAIRDALEQLYRSDAGSSPDALVRGFGASLRALENFWDYRDYQTAVLLPGLSPAQRRLLFASALEKLALPLPGAEKPVGLN